MYYEAQLLGLVACLVLGWLIMLAWEWQSPGAWLLLLVILLAIALGLWTGWWVCNWMEYWYQEVMCDRIWIFNR